MLFVQHDSQCTEGWDDELKYLGHQVFEATSEKKKKKKKKKGINVTVGFFCSHWISHCIFTASAEKLFWRREKAWEINQSETGTQFLYRRQFQLLLIKKRCGDVNVLYIWQGDSIKLEDFTLEIYKSFLDSLCPRPELGNIFKLQWVIRNILHLVYSDRRWPLTDFTTN